MYVKSLNKAGYVFRKQHKMLKIFSVLKWDSAFQMFVDIKKIIIGIKRSSLEEINH